ncbi:MAG: alpha-galactosidase [Victivallales bacterium]|nr:alpha-galactosidase [Victivallales bacterium]
MKLFLRKLSDTLKCGQLSAGIFVRLKAGVAEPSAITAGQVKNDRIIHLRLEYEQKLVEDLFFEFFAEHLVCRRHTANTGNRTLELVETGFDLTGLDFGRAAGDDYFYHNENPRIYDKLTLRLDLRRGDIKATASDFDAVAGNRWCDPGVITDRIGASPYQPFPAILLSNYQSDYGVVHGTLSQKVFFHNYLCGHRDGRAYLSIFGGFKAVGWRELAPDEAIDDIWYLGYCGAAADLEQIFAGYVRELKKHLRPMWGATAINRHSLVWGSWNDGISRNITHEEIVKNAEFLSANYPTVRWIQVDDGYSTSPRAHGLGMPYECEAGLDRRKFPDGLKKFTDDIKAAGLRPAVWIGGLSPQGTRLFTEKPEWHANYDFRMPDNMVLDVSNPEVRAYMKKALDFFFREASFEGLKHDFWSYAFEDSHDLLRYKSRSGYEWRYWWLNEIRKRIPDDAYFQTGCDIAMGNPFLGEFFTNYRYGIDIGSGKWDYVKTNFLWGMACFATHTGDLFVPNSDSVGLFPGLTDREARLCLNYCMISRSMVELAGWLYKAAPDNPRFRMLKKAICCPNNGQNVYFAGFDYRHNDQAPAKWFLRTPHFSRQEEMARLPLRTVAIFNLGEAKCSFELPFREMGLAAAEYRVTDVWQDCCRTLTGMLRVELEPHDSVLCAVNAAGTAAEILDSDLEVEAVENRGSVLLVTFSYPGAFTLTLSQCPKNFAAAAAAGCFLVSGKTGAIPAIELQF